MKAKAELKLAWQERVDRKWADRVFISDLPASINERRMEIESEKTLFGEARNIELFFREVGEWKPMIEMPAVTS